MDRKISSLFQKKKYTVSFEVFPPKKIHDENLEQIFTTISRLEQHNPDFISVTYGTGGKNRDRALKIAEFIENRKITALSHLTCYGYTKNEISEILDQLHDTGVKNILALRGDIPDNSDTQNASDNFNFAKDLIEFIKKDKRFCIGAAAYPEGHNDCKDINLNAEYTKIKYENGADFFITQLFFDNSSLYRFIELLAQKNVTAPVIPGIMPVLKASQIKRIIELTDARVPDKLKNIIHKFGSDDNEMQKAGIEFAIEQINDLLRNNVRGIHLYTMNKADQCLEIINSL